MLGPIGSICFEVAGSYQLLARCPFRGPLCTVICGAGLLAPFVVVNWLQCTMVHPVCENLRMLLSSHEAQFARIKLYEVSSCLGLAATQYACPVSLRWTPSATPREIRTLFTEGAFCPGAYPFQWLMLMQEV